MNACDYGNLPQNRERIYIVAFRNKKTYKAFDFPDPIGLTNKLATYIDFESQVNSCFYYTPDKYPFFPKLERDITRSDTLYQWRRVYVRENKNHLCPTLTANMGTGGHNVPLVLTQHGIRKLMPRECFNLMGYPTDYKLPVNMKNSQLYKQAGNSVAIPVVARIADQIQLAMIESIL